MRHEKLRMPSEAALRLLTDAPLVHLGTTLPSGEPVLRALNAVVLDGWVLFHGAKAGEKSQCLGRAALVSAERPVATIPSYFIDPDLACPATTLYESAQARGTLEDVEDPSLKAAMLTALMQKYQPEGGYAPIRAEAPEYAGNVRGVRVFGLRIEELSGKAKLGQNKPPEYVRKVLEGLWRRGAPGDVEAIRTICEAQPDLSPPAFLEGPARSRLEVALRETDLDPIVRLLTGQYWHQGSSTEMIRASHTGSTAWVGLRAPDGHLIGTGRAISDGARHAFVADIAIEEGVRGRGYGTALVRCLLDHPAVRGASVVRLGTADRQRFYEAFGFVSASGVDFGFVSTPMLLCRDARFGGVVRA